MLNADMLLDAMGGVRPELVTETARALGYDGAPARWNRGKKLGRALLLAAALTALLGATAYGAATIHQRRQQELRADLKIEENHVADYVQPEAAQAEDGAPGITLLSVLPDFDDFVRVYVDVYPVPEAYARDALAGSAALATGEDWDLESINYFSSLDDEGWQEAFVRIRDGGYAAEDLTEITDPDTGYTWMQPSAAAILRRELAEGYDAETKTLTLSCVFSRGDLPADAESAQLHIVCARYLANIDAQGIETENDAGLLIDFGTVEVPLAAAALRTVYFTQPREFAVEGKFGPVSGRFVGAELGTTGVTWLYEMDGSYDPEDIVELTDAMEADAVLWLADGGTVAVSMSVRSETGPVLRNFCGVAGTVDINAVVGLDAGGVHYSFRAEG